MSLVGISDLANLGGVLFIAVLLVWRIDVRLAAVETSVKNLCVIIEKVLGKVER